MAAMVEPARDFTDGPRWLEMYPRLISQFKEIMDEWAAEREGLLLQAEQTQAYCSSLAFQVKSLQEENAELRTALAADAELAKHVAAEEQEARFAAGRDALTHGNHYRSEDRSSPSRASASSLSLKSPTKASGSPSALRSARKQEEARRASERPPGTHTPSHSRKAGSMASSTPVFSDSTNHHPSGSLTPSSKQQQQQQQQQQRTIPADLRASHPASCEDVHLSLADDAAEREPLPLSSADDGDPDAAQEWECTFVSRAYAQPVHGIDCCPAERTVAAVCWDGSCQLFAQQATRGADPSWGDAWGRPARPGASGLYAVKFAARTAGAGGLLAAACADGKCYILDGADGRVLQGLGGHRDEVNDLCFYGSSMLATVSDDTTCLLWDVEQGAVRATLADVHSEAVYGVKFAPQSSTTLATVAFDKVPPLRGQPGEGGRGQPGVVWDVRSGGVVQRLEGHREEVIGLSFSPCGVLLATGSDDCACLLWDLRRTDRPVLSLEHDDEVKRVAWSPCGAMVATASADARAHVWRVGGGGGAERQSLAGHGDLVFDVQWLPPDRRGARLVTASHDKTWRAWGAKRGGGAV